MTWDTIRSGTWRIGDAVINPETLFSAYRNFCKRFFAAHRNFFISCRVLRPGLAGGCCFVRRFASYFILRLIFLLLLIAGIVTTAGAQNVFNINDPIVRYDKTKALGSTQNPNPAKAGLQKWVSTPTNGVSSGVDQFDASSFKAYFINYNGTGMAFRIKFPRSYTNPDSAAKKYPVMLFLHGAGEAGCPGNNGVYNNEKQLWLGGALFRDRVNNNQFDGFLLYPQLVNTTECWGIWGSTPIANLTAIIVMIDSLAKYTRANIDRVVVDGLSGGGYGAWRMAETFPQRIAKIIPSAAAGSTSNRTAFVHIPIWFATGGKDPDPSPAQADYTFNRMKEIGADIRYTRYPDLGHAVWNSHWREADFVKEMNDMHKANPLVFFQRNEFCANETIAARLGITPGFYAYEWQREGVTIATRINGTNTIVQAAHVSAFTGNEITVKSYGTYRVRFRRTASAAWSEFSPKPVVVKTKSTTQTPPITVQGNRSKVLPAPDGSTTVPLQLPAGFINYEWYRVSDNSLVATTQVFNAPAGVYRARYSEQYGCGTDFSPNFTVVNAAGTPKPDPAVNLTTTPLSLSSIRLSWTQGNNETGFEVYRGTAAAGPYTFAGITAANATTYTDTGLAAGKTYYFVVRAVNNTGAAAASNESSAKTLSDNGAPAAPSNLRYRGSTQSTVLLAWDASSDASGIKRYDIYVNGNKTFSTSSTSFNVFNLDSLQSYNFYVKAVDGSGNESPASNQATGYTHRQGINYRYYTTSSTWSSLPNFSNLNPAKTGITDSVNINNTGIKTATTRYGFLWQGFIYIPVTASYTFETVSDDGSKLYIDIPYGYNTAALVNNDGVHGAKSAFGTRTLTQGYHSIAVTYFQGVNGYDMQLYWSNNAGMARERIPKNFFSFVNGSLAATPAAPSAPAATALTYNTIRVNWTDNSSNETGFELVRSGSANGVFQPVGTVSANATSFTDSGLMASRAYYYKVRAIGSGGESGFAGPVNATTPAAPQTPVPPSQLEAVGGANNSVSLSWVDNATNETGYRVYRSTNGNDFTAVVTLPANANAYTDQSTVSQTAYYYYVKGINASGEGNPGNTVQIKAGNAAPVISTFGTLFVKTGSSTAKNFTVTDEPGDNITLSIPDQPSFITIAHTGGANYRLNITPTLDNVGWYTLELVATDNGGSSASQQLTIAVTDTKSRSVFVNLGHTGKTAPAPWNNWNGYRGAGNTISNLKDESNSNTSFSLTTVNAWVATTVMGYMTGNNSGIVPDAVLESGIADNGAAKQIRVGGLNPALRYNLFLVGSQNEGLVATAQYSAGSQSATLDARYNGYRAANLNGLIPDAGGQLLVTISRTGGSAYTYLNAVIIEEYSPATALLNPQRLYAEPLDRNRISLSWVDRAGNETGYELQRAADSMFSQSVTTISLPANTTSYTHTGLTPDTKYWYRVRARNGSNYSEYSNRFTTVTPASIVYVNFNTTITNAGAPWNNLAASPMSPFLVNGLKNQAGSNSNISLQLVDVFNGEFTAGVNTGNNSGIVPDNVLMSDYWLDNTQLSRFRLSGLNHTKRYRIGFVGSSSTAGWFKGDYTATYSINGRTVYLNSWMNSTKIVYIGDVVPDAGGDVLLDFSTTAIAQWGFTAGIIIHEYTDHGGGPVQYQSNSLLAEEPVTIDSTRILRAYPNPFDHSFTLAFQTDRPVQRPAVEVYDVTGRLVHRQLYTPLLPGTHNLKVDAFRDKGRGVYIVALKMDGKVVQTVKMLRK